MSPIKNHLIAAAMSFLLLGLIYTFGAAEIFDRLYWLGLFLCGLLCYKNFNVLSIVLLLFVLQSVEEGYYAFFNEYWAVIPTYALVVWCIWLFRSDVLAVVIPCALVLFATIAGHIYWFANDLDHPLISMYWFFISVSILKRYLLYVRAMRLPDRFSPEPLKLDKDIRFITTIYIFLQLFQITEYLARRSLLTDSTVIYYAFPYAAQFLLLMTLLLTISEAVRKRSIFVLES